MIGVSLFIAVSGSSFQQYFAQYAAACDKVTAAINETIAREERDEAWLNGRKAWIHGLPSQSSLNGKSCEVLRIEQTRKGKIYWVKAQGIYSMRWFYRRELIFFGDVVWFKLEGQNVSGSVVEFDPYSRQFTVQLASEDKVVKVEAVHFGASK